MRLPALARVRGARSLGTSARRAKRPHYPCLSNPPPGLARPDLIGEVDSAFELIEEHGQSTGNDAAICVTVGTACDGEGLTTPGLAIGKYGSVEPVEGGL